MFHVLITRCMMLVALVATISYSIENSENSNSTATNDTETDAMPVFLMFTSSWPIPDVDYKNHTSESKINWEECVEFGKQALKDKDEIEKVIPSLPIHSPSYRHHKVVATSAKARNLSRIGYVKEFATKHFYR